MPLVSRFEEALAAGTRATTIESCLSQTQENNRVALFQHLLHAQLRHRQQQGEYPTADEYRQRFPHFAAQIDRVFALSGATATVDYLPRRQNQPGDSNPAPIQVSDYEILGELGWGERGIVQKARDKRLGRLVALKMIRWSERVGPVERERFLARSQALAQVQHPHIVQIFDLGEHEGMPLLALEYCSGSSLAGYLKRVRPDFQQSARLVEILARTIAAVHQTGILHQNLKPANVLLAPDPNAAESASAHSLLAGLVPKLTDFGLSPMPSSNAGKDGTAQALATRSYLAPEQTAGTTDEVGPAADVWALGAILYECLTSRPPFRGTTVQETLEQIRTLEPECPSRLRPTIPPDLEAICLKCLEKEPARRYSSALELAEALRRFQAGQPIRARQPGLLQLAWRWVRRRPVTVSVVAASCSIGLVLMLALGGHVEDRNEGQREANASGTDALEEGQERRELPKVEVPKINPVGVSQQLRQAPDLSRFKPLFHDEFANPASGWPTETEHSDTQYRNGRYVSKGGPGSKRWHFMPVPAFNGGAVEVVGRVLEPPSDGWGVVLCRQDNNNRAVQVMIDSEARVSIGPWVYDADQSRGPFLPAIKHEAVKAGGEFNTLLLVVQRGALAVYVNGAAIREGVSIIGEVLPGRLLLQKLAREKGVHVEIKSVTVWGPLPSLGMPPSK